MGGWLLLGQAVGAVGVWRPLELLHVELVMFHEVFH